MSRFYGKKIAQSVHFALSEYRNGYFALGSFTNRHTTTLSGRGDGVWKAGLAMCLMIPLEITDVECKRAVAFLEEFCINLHRFVCLQLADEVVEA